MGWQVVLAYEDGRSVEPPDGGPGTAFEVPYVFSPHVRAVFPLGLEATLHGKTGRETTDDLKRGVAALGAWKDDGYEQWQPSRNNVGYALAVLLRWAIRHPDARFTVYGLIHRRV